MAHRINATDSPKLSRLVVSFYRYVPPLHIFIITISTIFNKHKKQKLKIVENVENLDFFQPVFNIPTFSTETAKNA